MGNTFADAVLTDVFDHARALRARSTELSRSIVFTSYNPHICTALNWKQPNFPVLLCNGLGSQPSSGQGGVAAAAAGEDASLATAANRNAFSIKESVRLAQSNNFMGVMCSARILKMVPALVETIKHAGLVLVSDSSAAEQQAETTASASANAPGWAVMPEGVNGLM